MNEPNLPQSVEQFTDQLRTLHEKRRNYSRPPRRLKLTPEQRADVLRKTDARCHLCGGEIKGKQFAADHVLPHAAGGKHKLPNYLASHRLCNGCRWFYSPEEVQWILRMGVWVRKQIEDRTYLGEKIAPAFLKHENKVRARRKYEQGQ
jgi:5-methylcytosine-specific restriction endonuclease McrA